MVGSNYSAILLLLIIYLFNMNMFTEFSIISWNIHGGANKISKCNYKELARRYHLSLFVLLETHVNFLKVKNFWYNIGYTPVAVSKAQGHAGGIWVLSSVSSVSLSTLDINRQCVIIQIYMESSS
jgi:hypothetical protein